MDTAVYLQIALLAYFCLIICHMARYDKQKSTHTHNHTQMTKKKSTKKKQTLKKKTFQFVNRRLKEESNPVSYTKALSLI